MKLLSVPLSDETVLEALRLMMLSRRVDTVGFGLNRQGRFGTFSQVLGQEASVVGSAFALDRTRDWIVPQYRELPALLHHGYPLVNFLRYFMGDPAGGAIPDDVNMIPIQISIAAHLPHAVGLAWGLKMQNKDSVVLTYFGDGGSSEGDFHEACNLAGIVRAPMVFFLQNNGWAISTPRSKQSAAPTLAQRAEGYGFRGLVVDGNDLFAVYAATRDAVERARAGEGPTLIESMTYRLGAHNTSDDPTRYRPRDEAAPADPIARVEAYLAERGLWDAERKARMEREVAEEVEAAVAAAAAEPPSAARLFENVYGDPPKRMLAQRARKLERC